MSKNVSYFDYGDHKSFFGIRVSFPIDCLICGSTMENRKSRSSFMRFATCDDCFSKAEIIPLSRSENRELYIKLKKVLKNA